MSQPTLNEGYDDSFARKTWTDLARGKTQSGKQKKEKGDVSSLVPEYSLAQHNLKNQRDIEAIDEEDDIVSGAQSSHDAANADQDAP